MLKNIFINLVVAGAFFYILMVRQFNNLFTLRFISDSLFVVGMVMLSIGIITTTNITDVFLGFKYSFRQLWGRRNKEHLSFYDYQNSKKKDRKSTGGLPTLIVGIMVVSAASIIAIIYVY